MTNTQSNNDEPVAELLRRHYLYISYESSPQAVIEGPPSPEALDYEQFDTALRELIQSRERAAEKLGAETIIALADARTQHALAPDHDNYIIKCYMVDAYLQKLTNPQAGEGSEA